MRAGVFQSAGGGLTPDERIERLAHALAANPQDLVVCPELFLTGYNVGDRIPGLAEERGGAGECGLTQLARTTGTTIVYGYAERHDGRLYNAAACIAPSGDRVANHRKLMLPPGFEGDHFCAGQGKTLFEAGRFRCGLAICYDAEFPETVRALAAAGAEVIVVPTALSHHWDVVAQRVMPARAFENGVWLLYANHCGEENGMRYLGQSCIIAPDGRDAARARDQETLISTVLDKGSIDTMRQRLPYLASLDTLRQRLTD